MRNVILIITLLVLSLNGLAEEVREEINDWRVYTGIDNKTQKVVLSSVLFSFDGEDSALGLRCNNHMPELYIMFSDEISFNLSQGLIIKLDGKPYSVTDWTRASDMRGIFSENPTRILDDLKYAKSMIVTYKTRRHLYKVTAFNLNGIEQIVAKINKACLL